MLLVMNLSMFSAVAPLLTTSPIIITFARSLPERLSRSSAWFLLVLAVLLTAVVPAARRLGQSGVASGDHGRSGSSPHIRLALAA